MTDSASPEMDPKIQDAEERIDVFGRRFTQEHLDFAYHAAFPLTLTPDLLYRLRDYLITKLNLQISWIAVADLLLSGLCYEVGEELYEINITMRQVLLSRLTQDSRFGKERLEELSTFLLDYINLQIGYSNDNVIQAQYWTALSYNKPEKAAKAITEKLAKMLQQRHKNDWLQMAFLVETLAQPLKDAGFEPLLILAQSMEKSARGELEGAKAKLEQLHRQHGDMPNIAGVTFHFVPAQTFTFDVVTVNATGKIINREQRQAQYFTENLPQDITLEMVAIPDGTFLMGSLENEEKRYNGESPQHKVTVPAFFMGKYPVTQAQWRTVAALPQIKRNLNPNPWNFQGDNLPVERISWYDAVEFCDRLSKYSGKYYRLPNEAEWEYACRAGTTTPFHFGETITTDVANYRGTDDEENKWSGSYGKGSKGIYREQTTEVGSFEVANAFGLYDMHGNVWEWCADHWHDNYEGAPTDGSAWLDDNDNDNRSRLLRGGSWFSNPLYCRSACRNRYNPDVNGLIGFRVVCGGAAARTP